MSRARDTADQINRVNSSAADATAITVDSSENVGINTSSPSAPLTVKAPADAEAIHVVGRSDDIGQVKFLEADGTTELGIIDARNSFFNIGSIANIPLKFATNNSERMRITSSGRVGIGTTSPSSPKFSSSASGVLELRGSKPSFNVQESDYTDAHFNMSMSAGNAYLAATGTGNLILATGTAN